MSINHKNTCTVEFCNSLFWNWSNSFQLKTLFLGRKIWINKHVTFRTRKWCRKIWIKKHVTIKTRKWCRNYRNSFCLALCFRQQVFSNFMYQVPFLPCECFGFSQGRDTVLSEGEASRAGAVSRTDISMSQRARNLVLEGGGDCLYQCFSKRVPQNTVWGSERSCEINT
jgi:hypothetical protein